MTHLQFRDRLADVMNAYNSSNQSHLANTIREMIREFDAGLTDSSPHPDTARADAAERMLGESEERARETERLLIAVLSHVETPMNETGMKVMYGWIPTLEMWWAKRRPIRERQKILDQWKGYRDMSANSVAFWDERIVELEAIARAEAARLDAELAAIGGSGS